MNLSLELFYIKLVWISGPKVHRDKHILSSQCFHILDLRWRLGAKLPHIRISLPKMGTDMKWCCVVCYQFQPSWEIIWLQIKFLWVYFDLASFSVCTSHELKRNAMCVFKGSTNLVRSKITEACVQKHTDPVKFLDSHLHHIIMHMESSLFNIFICLCI